MLKYYIAVLSFYVFNVIHAQENTVTGKIIGPSKKYIPGVTVNLLRLADSTAIKKNITDSAGIYRFNKVPPGNYFIKASATGMHDACSKPFLISGNAAFTVDTIPLSNAENILSEVKVTAKNKQVELRQGKIIYNVEKSITASGSSAFEILRKTPGIGVGQDESLLLKGNANVTVMIDGKMTYLSSQQLTILLKSTPAENISRVEVSSNPSSEFDAAGNAGVINIITKKLNRDGYALNISAGAGTGFYPQTTESITGNIKTKRFNFFGSYTYNYKKSYLNRTSYRVIQNDNKIIVYDRYSFDPEKTSNNNYKAGIDFYINKNSQFSFVYNGYSNDWSRDAAGPTYLREPSGKVDSVVQNHNITHEPQRNNAFNINYDLKLDTSGSSISIDADYASYKSNSDGFLGNQLFTGEGEPLQPYQQLNFQQPGEITIRTVKSDFKYALGKTSFKAGLKYAYVRSDNNSVYDSLVNNQYVYSSALSNHFVYGERIFAGYISASRQLNKTGIDAGLRIENTVSKGNSITAGLETKRNYTSVFPYVSAEQAINDNHTISLTIARRIDRPVYSNLNPFRYFFDKYSYYEGNPLLQPEFAWNTTLSYTLQQKYTVQFTYGYTSNPIAEFATQDDATGILKVTTHNFSHKNNYDALFIIPVAVSKWWIVQNSLDVFYASYKYQQANFSINRLTTELVSTHEFKLPSGISIEITADYETPTISGSYILHHWFTIDAGLKKTFKKLDIKLACTDIFKTIHYWGYSVYSLTNISYNHVSDTRRVNLSFLYHFGGKLAEVKMEKSEEEKRVQ